MKYYYYGVKQQQTNKHLTLSHGSFPGPDKVIMVDSSPGAEVSTQPQTPDDAFLQAQALLQAVTSKPQVSRTRSWMNDALTSEGHMAHER